ncbi:DUF397 domain-containing protein [Streptomyces sp. yr375]|uniref:DUF397 domain-containing protein n=1 Tax=Streptomyces sp. yr375 TaxID=1761906 RepID=UPI000B84B4F7|nr:DUF397 domain-containing protein [Streptomyces sp. yr375]
MRSGRRRSTYSGGEGGEGLEVAGCPHTVLVRDSKNPGGPRLTLSTASSGVFVTHAAG